MCARYTNRCDCFRDQNEVDVRAVYHQLMDTYVTTDSDGDNEAGPSTSNGSGARRYVYSFLLCVNQSCRPLTKFLCMNFRSKRLRRGAPEIDWRVKCRDLLDVIWQSGDSEPFREPVDLIDHPGKCFDNYLQIVKKIILISLCLCHLQIT